MSGKELTRFLGKVETLLHEDLCRLSVDEVKVGLEHILSKIKAMLDSLQNNGVHSTDFPPDGFVIESPVEDLLASSSIDEHLDESIEEKNIFFYLDENNRSITHAESHLRSADSSDPLEKEQLSENSNCFEMKKQLKFDYPDTAALPPTDGAISEEKATRHVIESGDPSAPFACRECGKEYKSINGIRYHCSVAHSLPAAAVNPAPLRCPEEGCSYTTPTLALLRVHANSHANNAPLTCPICKKEYLGGKKAMKQHMKLHGTKRDHKCENCGKMFINASRLNYHIQNVHSEPMFHCDQCSKMFRSKVNFNRHMRIHTDEKPFGCPYCAFTSNHATNMTSHVRSVHKDSLFTTGREEKSRKRARLVKNIMENKTGAVITSLLGTQRIEPTTLSEDLGKSLLKELSDKGEVDAKLATLPPTPKASKATHSFLKNSKCDNIITVRNSEGLLVNAVVKVKKGRSDGDQVLHVCVKE